MPNFGYITVQFIHLLALALWIGGTLIIVTLTAPAVFEALSPRASAGALMGRLFRQFDRVKDVCSLVLIVTSIVKFIIWERNWTVWFATRYLAIAVMIVTALAAGWVVGPMLRELHAAGAEDRGDEEAARFRCLHRVSALLMQVGLVAALVALFLS